VLDRGSDCAGGCGSPRSRLSSVELDHVSVDHTSWLGLALGYAGSFARLASVSVRSSSFDHDGQGAVVVADSVAVTNSLFTATGGPSALRVDSASSPRVQANTISGTTGVLPAWGCTAASFCQLPTAYVSSPALDLSLLTGNSGSGNAQQSFEITGTLTASGSLATLPSGWTPVIGGLTVAQGVTLTVPAGSTVKVRDGARLLVDGGALVAAGTSAQPIIFTSIRDPGPGGTTDTSRSPAHGDWRGIVIDDAGSLTASDAAVAFADTAFDFVSGDGLLSNLKATDDIRELVVTAGHISLRGRGVRVTACEWGSTCAVDAAYVDWGPPAGPFPTSGDLVCGAVTTTPWIDAAGTPDPASNDSPLFRAKNCSGTPTPDLQVASAAQSADHKLDPYRIQCANGYEAACKVIEDYERCFGAAVVLAKAASPFPFTDPGNVAEVGSLYLKTSENPIVATIGDATHIAGQVISAIRTILEIRDAYDKCVP
jgi:hypothetical protein